MYETKNMKSEPISGFILLDDADHDDEFLHYSIKISTYFFRDPSFFLNKYLKRSLVH